MSWTKVSVKRKKRNKSSPLEKEWSKKYKSDIDDNISDYSENSEHSVFSDWADPEPDASAKQINMVSKLSNEELKEISKDLVHEIKADLITELKNEFKAMVQIETELMRTKISVLQEENNNLKSSLKSALLQIDDLEQYGRRMCLDISGIPGDTGDAKENIEKKILDHLTKIKLPNGQKFNITSRDIDKCHRKGRFREDMSHKRKVIVKFTNSKARQGLYDNRKILGAGIFVQENLTRHREQMAYEARKLVRDKKLTKTWVAGCKVFASMKINGSDEMKINITDIDTNNCIREGRLPTVNST